MHYVPDWTYAAKVGISLAYANRMRNASKRRFTLETIHNLVNSRDAMAIPYGLTIPTAYAVLRHLEEILS